MIRVLMSAGAFGEAEEAQKWYDDRKSGLGTAFVEALDEAILRIQLAPEAYPRFEGRFRKCVLRRFPYFIIFEWQIDYIRILSVFHSSRDASSLRNSLLGRK